MLNCFYEVTAIVAHYFSAIGCNRAEGSSVYDVGDNTVLLSVSCSLTHIFQLS